MSEQQPRTASASIDPATEAGHLALSVADLGRSVSFYTQAIGLREVSQGGGSVALGVAKKPLLILNEQPGAKPWPRGGRSYTGLYHFAILVPSRPDLGRWLSHWFRNDMPMPGQGDHLVSEALYLEDPDRHGIEVYRDRPRDEWQWDNGRVRMASDPVDLRGLLEEAEQSAVSWDGMPDGTKLGHIHLQVSDIEETARFYSETLGFDVVAQMPSALFMSAGGYHHHIGANIWHSRGATQPPGDSVNLQYYTVDFPTNAARDAVIQRLEGAGIDVNVEANKVYVRDPSGITIRLHSEEGGR
jgi:catechol 2,3-dioxygenase